jgi:hypothetical protein
MINIVDMNNLALGDNSIPIHSMLVRARVILAIKPSLYPALLLYTKATRVLLA